MSTGKKAKGGATRTAARKPQPGGTKASPGKTNNRKSVQVNSKPDVTLTHEQIAQRAEHIWRQGGCLPGRDEQNWKEAEAQLKAELGGG